MNGKPKIDLEQLAIEIRKMKPRQKLFIVLQTELSKLGRWRVKGRGDAKKGYATMREHKVKNG